MPDTQTMLYIGTGMAALFLFKDNIIAYLQKDKTVVNTNGSNPAPKTEVPTPPPKKPAKVVHEHEESSIVSVVAGWHCFKKQCEEAGLDAVCAELNTIFPMLLEVSKREDRPTENGKIAVDVSGNK